MLTHNICIISKTFAKLCMKFETKCIKRKQLEHFVCVSRKIYSYLLGECIIIVKSMYLCIHVLPRQVGFSHLTSALYDNSFELLFFFSNSAVTMQV